MSDSFALLLYNICYQPKADYEGEEARDGRFSMSAKRESEGLSHSKFACSVF
ncbi:hypothetical protein [Pseudomonas sp. PDM33]|uniref:hypothetical protein n=1 Tax=unclassified Pseudomonas TaxID=196821 RepID=UPI000AB82628